ncbi:uncharacterized protein LOC111300264 [Durio zibethinus]|uniref:Uncharacterized protein LOC111300264 n=1 Tax=Durio zibethinus TaxID=66656 RepID=A0A6P5ZFS0_DURZI|nr:uncharacterized protein LOC111300264 [Durio zibethinus]
MRVRMRSSKRSPRARRKVLVTRGRNIRRQSLSLANESGAAAAAESVRTSIERKLRQLQRMLPAGCAEINMETLFQRTAEHIFLLEAKVRSLQNLSTFCGI